MLHYGMLRYIIRYANNKIFSAMNPVTLSIEIKKLACQDEYIPLQYSYMTNHSTVIQGSFGVVFLVSRKNSRETLVMKQVNLLALR